MASRDEIDRVRSAVNILDVVTPYVALKRSGSVWKGLCPFHAEKTASFQVNPDKGAWYCFGCSEGGDAFKFIERIENLSFAEALARLATQLGIALSDRRESPADLNEREQMYAALDAAASFYQETLSRSLNARQYLLDRGITLEYQSSFRLGYAGESFEALSDYLRQKRVDLRVAVKAGVLAKSDRENAAPYDKLRGRVVCPILDVHDRPIAFGGRLTEDLKDRPKYLNTAETPLFSKGKTFFAMSRARKAIADLGFAIVVEGYFDVISAHQAGYRNVLATLGTALTPEHANILGRHARRVILAFDADSAGAKAAQRANSIFESKDFEVQVLDMPPGEDPDSLLRAGRDAEFQRAVDGAVPIREFQLRSIVLLNLSRQGLSERDRSAVFRRDIVPLLRSTKSPIEQERYIRLSAPLHPFFENGAAYAEDQIRQEIGGQPQQSGDRQARGGVRFAGQWGAARNPRAGLADNPNKAPRNGLREAEENLLRALISDDDSLVCLIRERAVTAELFVTPACRELARRMLSTDGSSSASRLAMPVQEVPIDGNNEISMLSARLMSEGDAFAQGPEHAPLTGDLVKDSIQRLVREQTSRTEDALRARADCGDRDAQQELMQLLRKMHENQSNAAGYQKA